jgi:N-acetylneuraminate synthase
MSLFKINNYEISINNPPYIIAEISANHNGSISRAKESIKIAKECGAHAVKIQTFTPDSMTINCDKSDFMIRGGLWDGYKLYDLYKEAHTPYEWHHELFDYAENLGVTLFSTPFDENAVDLLESLNTPAYKISSFELTDLPLISYVAKKGRPMLMSTGMADENEISEALETAKSGGCSSILLFHCISSYPTPIAEANLRKISNLGKTFDVLVGLSDHTLGNIAAISAIGLGACAIEKHFTLSREEKGLDTDFSINPIELKSLVRDTKDAWLSLGESDFNRSPEESKNKIFRRSIYFICDIKAGEIISKKHIGRIRPGFGLPPKYFDSIIGKKINCDVNRGDPVSWDVFE